MNDAWLMLLAVGSLLAISCGLLGFAWTKRRLGLTSVLLLVAAASAWVLGFVAVVSGFRDADGFVDCRDDCSPVQRAAALAFVAPPLLISLAAGGLVVALVARARARRAA